MIGSGWCHSGGLANNEDREVAPDLVSANNSIGRPPQWQRIPVTKNRGITWRKLAAEGLKRMAMHSVTWCETTLEQPASYLTIIDENSGRPQMTCELLSSMTGADDRPSRQEDSGATYRHFKAGI